MRCMTFAKKTGLVALLAIMVGGTTSFAADESGVIGQFRGDDPKSELSINYNDLSALLEQTVLDTGMSDRTEAGKARPTAGSRIIRGSTDTTRLEGNRIDFHSFLGGNLDVVKGLRDDLAKVPSVLPLNQLTRNEQLAYWLNLYNITLISQISEIFPETNLKKFYPSLWEEKVLTVAGTPLSLNDIHHKILIPKYKNPLIMYGLFQGVIGGPNIRPEAYTGRAIWDQLKDNAFEFINSNRGAFVRERILRASYFYEVNEALFPDFDRDVRRHLLKHAKPHFADKIMSGSTVVGTGQSNWYIADLYGGNRSKGSANTNGGALLLAFRTGSGAGAAGDAGGGAGGAVESAWIGSLSSKNMYQGRFPIHVIEYLNKQEIRNKKTRSGDVTIEEYDGADRIQGADKETDSDGQ
ncbi:DUF547 domain-containing protein [Kordiimonas lacus]|uniref:DUF547 domain-containing protein n=1 Tax=Kordiimonas lacus TaxID=637679 RepID=A0A1G7B2H8_9PROT|nr:DUF547 domain-containing protein [Kordiimonas lacus]SDE21233.1 Protein of unknown function, DUF547 [Kordiimonas lacus]